MNDKNNNWLCSLPWTGFSNDPDGKVRPCCIYKGHISDEEGNPYYIQTSSIKDIFASKYMKDLREDFRSGKKPVQCETCIRDESNKVVSKRETYFNHRRDYDFDIEPDFPVEYQIILSNACNLKCRSCTPSHSNTWQAEHKILFGNNGYSMPHGQAGHQKSLLWETKEEWISSVERLEIVGGEPFYIKQWADLWEELVSRGYSHKITLDMSTNCTIYGGEILEKIIPKFLRIGVGLSIDGMGDVYNYLRHPGKWDEVKENILLYYVLAKKYKGKFGASYTHTISWVNAWSLPEFHNWVNINTPDFTIWDNIIHSPRHMSLVMLPKSAKEKIENKWRKTDWKEYANNIDGIINFMNSEQPSDDEIKIEYQKFIIHDRFRNENILDIIPDELKEDLTGYLDIKNEI